MDAPNPNGTTRGRGSLFMLKNLLGNPPCTQTTSLSSTVDSGFVSQVNTSAESSALGLGGRRSIGRGRLLNILQNRTETNPFLVPPVQTIQTSSLESRGGFGRSKLAEHMKSLAIKSSNSTLPNITEAGEASVSPTAKFKPVEQPPELEIVERRGTKGDPVQITTNYIRLKTDPMKGVFEYEVRFQPNVHANSLRVQLLNQHRDTVIGNTKMFDGTTLYLPVQLPNNVTELVSTSPNDAATFCLQLIYKRKKRLGQCIQLYNVLFDRVMKHLNFVRFGRKRFNPSAPQIIPQHKLEVWPGYVTAVDEYEGGVMLCLDVSHRVLCQQTVLDLLRNAYTSDKDNFQQNAQTALLGSIVLTRYNNRTYRVDEVKFDASPMDTFMMNDRIITYVDYYKSQYNITIQDTNQPLLVHTEERVVIGKSEKELVTFCLIPEICYLTGMTDKMRSDFRLMRDIATITRVTPDQRMKSFEQFCTSVNSSPETKAILTNWGLELEPQQLQLQARQLMEEEIQFRRTSCHAGPKADFSNFSTSNEVLTAVHLKSWLVVHTRNDMKFARTFIDCMERFAGPMGIQVGKARVEVLENDRTELWVRELRRVIQSDVQMVVLICPTSRDDRYAAIKKVCCSELPVPSQVINSRTLSNDTKNRSIVQKIALQMNCKMGGSLWSVKIPFENVMICGVDTYHDPAQKSNSVVAFVASLNSTFTKWYSQAIIQKAKEELGNGLNATLAAALRAYKAENNRLPDKIIIFRDGVGDGQLNMCRDYEIPQLENAIATTDPQYKPKLTFIVVQKRINTRIFVKRGPNSMENPLPGCVVDHTITRRHYFDFFLVPQNVRQGTVGPTHYIVIHDTADFSPDVLQRLSYKLCFLYYNWAGTVRVPACCQYAHKLAYLVGQSVKRPFAETLADKLFYL